MRDVGYGEECARSVGTGCEGCIDQGVWVQGCSVQGMRGAENRVRGGGCKGKLLFYLKGVRSA